MERRLVAVAEAPGSARRPLARSLGLESSLVWLILAAGAAFRIYQYLINRSLWLDESQLALNITRRGAGSLLTNRLELNQGSPPGFLLVERLMVDAFGKSEYALRAFPLVCSLIALPVFAALARRILPPFGVVVAAALFAVSGPLIYFSSEVKQYSTEIMAVLALLLMSVMLVEEHLSRRQAIVFGLLGALLMQFSFAAVIAAAAGGMVIAVGLALGRRRRDLLSALPTLALWGVGGILFLVYYANSLGGYGLGDSRPRNLAWFVDRARDLSVSAEIWHPRTSPWIALTFAVCLLAALGLASLFRKRPLIFALLLAPGFLLLVLAVAHRYLIAPRSIEFLVPLIYLVTTLGIVELARRVPRDWGLVAVAIFTLPLVVGVSSFGNSHAGAAIRREEIKDELVFVARHWRAADVLYVEHNAQYAFAYYAECDCLRLPGGVRPNELWPVGFVRRHGGSPQFVRVVVPRSKSVLIGAHPPRLGRRRQYEGEVAKMTRHRRAWVLTTWIYGHTRGRIISRQLLGALERRGVRVTTRAATDARLYLYSFARR